ncbi:MAG TPA: cytochrome c [Steroidobacteraceae bacterium]
MSLSSRLILDVLLVTVALGASVQAHGAGDPARGKELAYTCLGCHGIEGYDNVYPTYSVPRLFGQHPNYVIAALHEYKSGQRSHGTMHQQAASLSDQDIEDIASYFGSLTLKPTAAPVGEAPPKATLCASCHGKNGVGITGDYPNLAGQHADYLARALQEYAHGDRKNPIMPNFVVGLTPSDMEQIAEYYSRQAPPLETVPRRQTFLSSK